MQVADSAAQRKLQMAMNYSCECASVVLHLKKEQNKSQEHHLLGGGASRQGCLDPKIGAGVQGKRAQIILEGREAGSKQMLWQQRHHHLSWQDCTSGMRWQCERIWSRAECVQICHA